MKINNVSKSYGDKVIFDNFSLHLEKNTITAVMGASGIGKTTLLKMIAGLTDYSGEIIKEGRVSYVFGESSLIPALTVKQNLEYAVKHLIANKELLNNSIFAILKELEMEKELNAYPKALSTGMAQRVAIARGFLYPAKYILMDEPFRGLDTSLKNRLQKYFLKLLSKDQRTVLLITHDVNEALLLADRVIVFDGNPINMVLDEKITIPQANRSINNNEIAPLADKILKALEK